MVAGGVGTDLLWIIELEDTVAGSSDFEGSCFLKILAFEEDLCLCD